MAKEKLQIISSFMVYDHEKELNKDEQLLILKAKEASKKAYAPYSNFHVGAAILLSNNEIVSGNNQENSAYPSGLSHSDYVVPFQQQLRRFLPSQL